jgi:hypothetical protein
MSLPRPVVDEAARVALDELDHPISIARAIRDHDDSIVDFAFVFLNRAAGEWAAMSPDAVVGLRATAVLPVLRSSGLLEALARVVDTGEPFSEAGGRYEGSILGGPRIDGRYDLLAIRLGDGYVSAWRRVPEEDDEAGDSPDSKRDLRASLAIARDVVRLVRLESRVAKPARRSGPIPA